MGGIIVPNTKISGAVAQPGIPLADSPVGGLYETSAGGVGMALAGGSFFELNKTSFILGYKPPAPFNFSLVAGSPFATGVGPDVVAISPDGVHVFVGTSGSNNLNVFARNSTTGQLIPVVGSPFAMGGVSYGVAVSPDGAHVFVVVNGANAVAVFSRNANTGFLTPVAGSPFAVGISPRGAGISPDGVHVFVCNTGDNTVSVFARNAGTGFLTPVVGSPFATGAQPTGVAVSPDSAHVFITNVATNNLSVFARNAGTGFLTPVVGSPFATGTQPTGVAVSPDSAHVLVTNTVDNTVSVFALNSISGVLTAVAGSPFATGGGPIGVVVSPNGTYVFVTNQIDNTVSLFTRNAGTGMLIVAAGSPFAVGLTPQGIAVSPDGAHVITANSNSNNVSVFGTAASPTFHLLEAFFDAAGMLNGLLRINGQLQIAGNAVLNQSTADARYAALAGLLAQAFSAKSLTLDNVLGGLVGTAAANNAAAGMVGEYIESTVLLAAAIALATGVVATVTSIALTAGDWDVEGVVAFHGSGTTNINDIAAGVNSVAATLGPVGSYETDYLMIVPAVGIDATYAAPKTRFSLAAPATIYLVAMAHFTISTCSAYGHISARRVR